MRAINKTTAADLAAPPVENLPPDASDLELLRKAAAGDRRAFERIYWRHHRKVYRICLRMLKNAAEAEEATQKVFLDVFRKSGGFHGETTFIVWLHRLTVGEVLRHFRAAASRADRKSPAPVNFRPIATGGF